MPDAVDGDACGSPARPRWSNRIFVRRIRAASMCGVAYWLLAQAGVVFADGVRTWRISGLNKQQLRADPCDELSRMWCSIAARSISVSLISRW